MKSLKTNILIVGLNEQFVSLVSKQLADALDMYVVNVNSLIEYELVNSEEMLTFCGIEYYNKQEKRCLKHASKFVNTVIDITYDVYSQNSEIFLTSCTSIYVKLPETEIKNKSPINKIAFADRDKTLSEVCDFVIIAENQSTEPVIKSIFNTLGGEDL